MTAQSKGKAAAVALLTFCIPGAILLAAYAAMGITPFGDKSPLIMDMSSQYVEFLAALRHGDVFFSWGKSLGTNYVGVFSYYVSSPFSLLTLLFRHEHMPLAVALITVLKIAAAGLTFGLFYRGRFGRYDAGTVLFSICYGLISFSIAFSLSVMWLDGVFWLPVICLGIEKLLAGGRPVLLVASLFVCFVSNYYISYMCGLFSALYLVLRLLELGDAVRWKTVVLRFAGSAALAAGLGAFLLLPTLLSLFEGKLATSNVEYDGLLTFMPGRILRKLLPGGYDSLTNTGAIDENTGSPNIYAGMLVWVFFALFFLRRGVGLRSKLLAAGMTALLLASMLFSPLDKVWHIFQKPNWFPFRYSFVLSFFLVLTAARAFVEMNVRLRPGALVLLALAVSGDMFYNTYGILRGLDSQFHYVSNEYYTQYTVNTGALVGAAKERSQGFYRINTTSARTFNEPMAYGYSGIGHYSSSFDEAVNRSLSALGFAQEWFWVSGYGSTPVTDSLFSVGYVLSEWDMPRGYLPVAENSRGTLYENTQVLPVGLVARSDELARFQWGEDPFENQTRLLTGISRRSANCFSPLEYRRVVDTEEQAEWTFVSDGNPVYVCFSSSQGQLRVNGHSRFRLGQSETSGILYLGTFPNGETVTLHVQLGDDQYVNEPQLYSLDLDMLHRVLDGMRQAAVEVTAHDRSGITADVSGQRGDTVVFSIPYNRGWQVKVDGAEVEYGVFADFLLTVPIEQGEHTVELRYTPPGLRAGVVISALSGVLCLALVLAARVLRQRRSGGR